MSLNATMLREFANPPSAYRGKPFWAWNGKLEPEELRRQIRIMKRMGLGGFFMHSRVGLDTAYLSDDWFKCVGACVDEARAQKMEAWLYDEDRWPSGAAGGLVTKNPAYRMRSLVMDELTAVKGRLWTADTMAVFSATVRAGTATNLRRLRQGERPAAARGATLLRFRVEVDKPSDWYNGQTYLDTLNPAAVREFIRQTHEAYLRHNGRDFGSIVPGIFTDEPNYGGIHGWRKEHGRVPWTGSLPAVFRSRYGYNVSDWLPALFLDMEGPRVAQARWHFVDCITHLFVTAFSRQIGQWCGTHNLLFTGHVLSEETLSSQTHVVGSTLRHYEYMQAPGMDLLTQVNREYDTAKQVSSVARQFGAKWRLTETYGCTGWDFPLEGHKALGDWQAALGINLRCQHLAWYTMLAEAKRDYPAGIFYQSPWWELYPVVEDYFGRVGAVMTRGEEVRDVLVIHPVESVWLHVRRGWQADPAVKKLDRMIVDLRGSLLAANLDFDYGDEDILARHGRVVRGEGGATLRVAKADYRVVVVPPLETIRSTTLALLEKFSAAGGVVVQAGKAPGLVDALPSSAARRLARHFIRAPAKGEGLASAVGAFGRRVSITDTKGRQVVPALHLLRRDRENYYLFVCNTSEDFRKVNPRWVSGDVRVEKRTLEFADVTVSGFGDCEGAPVELDPESGKLYAADASRVKDQWRIRTSLPRLGSRLFVVPRKRAAVRCPRRPALRTVHTQTLNRPSWDITLSEHNVLVLDRPRYAINGGREQGPEEILRVDGKVRDALGIRHRGGAMVQPWARERSASPKKAALRLRYEFTVAVPPSGEVLLALEEPGRYTVRVNGAVIDTERPSGWWCDRSLATLRVPAAALRKGTNTVELAGDYDENHPGLEIVYLLGAFGVRVSGTEITMTAAPSRLRLGNWVPQGLPFYSGHVGYTTTLTPKLRPGQRLFVHAPRFRGAAMRVLVNGTQAGVAGWPPYEIDITGLVRNGEPARLCIEVIGHRRNSHGPLHLRNLTPGWTGPGEFVKSGTEWTDGYALAPMGLMAPPKVVVKR